MRPNQTSLETGMASVLGPGTNSKCCLDASPLVNACDSAAAKAGCCHRRNRSNSEYLDRDRMAFF